MLIQDLIDSAAALVATARRHGADGADAVARASSAQSVSVRLGALEDIDRSEGVEIGLRAFVGNRSASVSTSDLSRAGMEELAMRAVAMARHAPEDEYAALAPADALANPARMPALDLADRAELSPAQLRDRAAEVEDAARAVAGVRNSEGGSAGMSRGAVALVTSTGFAAGYEGSHHSLHASVIAGEGARMQRDHALRSARHLADLPTAQEIGTLAGERAARRLDPGSPPAGRLPVVFDARVSASLVSHLFGAMAAPSLARRASFLADRRDAALFSDGIRLVEDPLRPRGPASRPFDGEGIACVPRVLVEHGRVQCWPSNVASAAQLGLPLTGHAARGSAGAPSVSATNVDLMPAEETLAAMIADIREGVLVDYLIGQGVNLVTGDYSRGAAGRRIVDGQIEGPIAGFTIAGNLVDMFAAMRVADDLECWRSINAPSIRVDGMTVATA
ncbi:TldD/PmbA family protein [Altererythrobacter aerius]|uniref:TldD/PmbA family protein n=1 Tax=Tsuneonella aeria TaxID=1837929 RepID=A0A6I4TD51_9SPHN|nr:TldD/PmbA family protein [Tsuneonella aeria]MXO75162.1 TldD/PmbA family protein [Tsuneonella aeria]